MKRSLFSAISFLVLIGALLVVLPSFVQAATIHVEAFIDGRSQLILNGNSAQWQHFDWSAPGIPQNPAENFPTTLNSANWTPSWAGNPTACGGCLSDTFFGVNPGLAAAAQTVTLNIIQARNNVTIVQQPAFANNYTLIVEFNDTLGGAAWYIIELDFPFATASASVPTMNEWGILILIMLSGIGAVCFLRRQNKAAK